VTILQALDGYYGRMAARGEAEAPGYSREKIHFAIVLTPDGAVDSVMDLRQQSGRKLVPVPRAVPAAVKRTAGIAPNLLWDKSAYVVGRATKPDKRTEEEHAKRIADEHAAFRKQHLELLANATDEGLLALRRFLESWAPERFDAPPFTPDMLDANIVFRLAGEPRFLHEREAAQALAAARGKDSGGVQAMCLVTGTQAVIERLHPAIKGVEGAQSSGAALVSFNLDAFTSYGKEQGDNAPTSTAAAFRYGTALNRMLDRGGRNRLPHMIGDATVVFWADASGVGEDAAQAADDWFGQLCNPASIAEDNNAADVQEAAKLYDTLKDIAAGKPLQEVDPRLRDGTRFHVLGLSPNAARLSVRFWLTDTLDTFFRRLAQHYDDIAIEPLPWRTPPSVQRLLAKSTALQEKFDNIPRLLAGEVMRAVLSGSAYPRTLLAAALIRLRAGDDPATGWHAAAIRGVLARTDSKKENAPMALDRENPNAAYQLGRMFALMEIAQRMALGKVNATIRDRYFGAASATPASVFPLLIRGAQNHLSRLRKDGKGGWVEKELEEIVARLEPEFPRALRLEEQGRFAIGYYHQRQTRVAGKPAAEIAEEEGPSDDE